MTPDSLKLVESDMLRKNMTQLAKSLDVQAKTLDEISEFVDSECSSTLQIASTRFDNGECEFTTDQIYDIEYDAHSIKEALDRMREVLDQIDEYQEAAAKLANSAS